MTPIVASYVLYIVLTIAMTLWVGRTLKKNGAAFLARLFREEQLAESVNHLLLVGFYLVNLGFIGLQLRTSTAVDTVQGAIEVSSWKIGFIAIVLGGMHFFNLFVFSRMWRARAKDAPLDAVPQRRRVDMPDGVPSSAAVPDPQRA